MKKKSPVLQNLIFLLSLAVVISSCSRINKARDLISKPTAKEIYEREYEEAPDLFALWQMEAADALYDSIAVNLPYAEKGVLSPRGFPVYSYEVALNPGERVRVEMDTDSSDTRIFIDLFQQQNDSLKSFSHIKSAAYENSFLQEEISQPGIYKVLVQPEIEANTPFELRLYREPAYTFPVADRNSSAVQSFWGAARDGGRRNHEGIDIFAPRGTPVVAATHGRVTSTGNKGLGGKQVWVRDRERGNSLYYAHLDSIIATRGMSVSPGDTLGLVGNTGNARTTPPHLHFGIYKGLRGAVNPIHYVSETEKPEVPEISLEDIPGYLIVTGARANLRAGPSTRSPILGQTQAGDTLRLLGKSAQWYHVSTPERKSFIHQSLVSPISAPGPLS